MIVLTFILLTPKHIAIVVSCVSSIQSFAYDGKTVIVAATLSDIKKAEQGRGDMDSKKLVRIPSKVGDLPVCLFACLLASLGGCMCRGGMNSCRGYVGLDFVFVFVIQTFGTAYVCFLPLLALLIPTKQPNRIQCICPFI